MQATTPQVLSMGDAATPFSGNCGVQVGGATGALDGTTKPAASTSNALPADVRKQGMKYVAKFCAQCEGGECRGASPQLNCMACVR